jgi:hypothetical protein
MKNLQISGVVLQLAIWMCGTAPAQQIPSAELTITSPSDGAVVSANLLYEHNQHSAVPILNNSPIANAAGKVYVNCLGC